MTTIHFLNVKEGDCSFIQHGSGRVSVIDVCNATPSESQESQAQRAHLKLASEQVGGNFNQKAYPVNPITYMQDHGVTSIFRYIQTHPDMDHMDGIKALFDEFKPENFWDTDNNKDIDASSWTTSTYNREDWEFYKDLRDSDPDENPKRLALLAGAEGQFWHCEGGDGITILAPTKDLVEKADDTNDYNTCSYVLLFEANGSKTVFGGDSHDDTWEYILDNFQNEVSDVDLLIAPHHGRDSDRSYEFLDVMKPKMTFFGNAPSEHLAYDAWYRRGLEYITNNQANCMVVDGSKTPMDLYVTNEKFARKKNPLTSYSNDFQAWFVKSIR